MSVRVGSLRRSSHSSSTSSLRRSSVSSRDIINLQQALANQRPISTHTVVVLLVFLPWLSYFILYGVHENGGALWETVSSLLFRWPFGLRVLPSFVDFIAWKIVVIFLSIQLLLYEVLPRDNVLILGEGTVEPSSRPTNGFSSTVILGLAYTLGAMLKFYRPDIVYQHFPSIIACLSLLAIATVILLYARYHFDDSPYIVDTTYEFFFGVELDPRLLEIELKHFLRGRVTMGLYALYTISSVFYSVSYCKSLHVTVGVSCFVHLFYILCWQWCEDVQLNGVDARRVNMGMARVWADLVLLPVLYTAPVALLAHQRRHTTPIIGIMNGILAFIFTLCAYRAARERLRFRQYKGNVKIGGKDPYFIMAKYRDGAETHANLLLGSGYWGMARHPSYSFDLLVHLCFTMLTGLTGGLLGYLPFMVLLAYCLIRIHFDEQRCLIKYGPCWAQHCSRVPYKLFKGIY